MSMTYGIEGARKRNGAHQAVQPAAKYLVLIDAAGQRVARMFLASMQEVAEFDAAAPEVLSMVDGMQPSDDALQPRWDLPLAGHSHSERAAAVIYRFSI